MLNAQHTIPGTINSNNFPIWCVSNIHLSKPRTKRRRWIWCRFSFQQHILLCVLVEKKKKESRDVKKTDRESESAWTRESNVFTANTDQTTQTQNTRTMWKREIEPKSTKSKGKREMKRKINHFISVAQPIHWIHNLCIKNAAGMCARVYIKTGYSHFVVQ